MLRWSKSTQKVQKSLNRSRVAAVVVAVFAMLGQISVSVGFGFGVEPIFASASLDQGRDDTKSGGIEASKNSEDKQLQCCHGRDRQEKTSQKNSQEYSQENRQESREDSHELNSQDTGHHHAASHHGNHHDCDDCGHCHDNGDCCQQQHCATCCSSSYPLLVQPTVGLAAIPAPRSRVITQYSLTFQEGFLAHQGKIPIRQILARLAAKSSAS